MFPEELQVMQWRAKGNTCILTLHDSKEQYQGTFASHEWFKNYLKLGTPPGSPDLFGIYNAQDQQFYMFVPSLIKGVHIISGKTGGSH